MSKLKEKKDIKMTIFIIVVGVSLMVAGIYGVVSSRIESRDYKNSTDIQKISAVIIDFSTSNSKDDSGDVKYTTYKFKVSYVIDGKTHKGKCEERVWWNSYEKNIPMIN
jgi:flagellar basal body-associated protein FliL